MEEIQDLAEINFPEPPLPKGIGKLLPALSSVD
jgi:hypothetical protein